MPQFANVLSSLLMSLPLVAVPALAIFGLPSAGSTSADGDEAGIALIKPSADLGDSTSHHDHHEGEHDDSIDFSFGEIQHAGGPGAELAHAKDSRRVVANAAGVRSAIATTSAHQGTLANSGGGVSLESSSTPVDPSAFSWANPRKSADDSTSGETENSSPVTPDRASGVAGATGTQSTNLACQKLLSRLRETGVKHFRLTNSDVAGKVFFCCSVRTSRNILQRFEAEAATPIAAVQDVLTQVESWQSTR